MDAFITVKTFIFPYQAYIVKGRLEEDGIECLLWNESVRQMLDHYSIARGGVQLQVRSGDVERAVQLLKEYGYLTEEDLAPPAYERYLEKFNRETGSMLLLNNLKPGSRFVLTLVIIVLLLASLIYLFTIYAGAWN